MPGPPGLGPFDSDADPGARGTSGPGILQNPLDQPGHLEAEATPLSEALAAPCIISACLSCLKQERSSYNAGAGKP
jgi:hypothetical protein